MTLEMDLEIARLNFFRVACNPSMEIDIINVYAEQYKKASDAFYKPKIEAIYNRREVKRK